VIENLVAIDRKIIIAKRNFLVESFSKKHIACPLENYSHY
jgi:hypothetical protein